MSNTDIRPYDKFYATLILNLLTKPFADQKAFSLGLINADGKTIKKPESEEEKAAFTPLYEVTFAVKRLIDSFPGTKNGLKQLAFSLNFIRQQVVPKQFNESVDYNRFLKEFALVLEHNLVLVEEEIAVEKYLDEEGGEGGAPATPTSGTTAGTVPDNSTENIDIHTPVINKMFKKKKVEESDGDN